MCRPRALRAVALGMAVGLFAVTAASSAIAADPSAAPASSASASWSGPKLTTTPMRAADVAAIDKLAQDAMAQSPDLPGMWIGVWVPAKGFYTQAYGEAVKGGAKATIDDHGRIGSVTKTFTIAAVLEQVAAGKLQLESTIKETLPNLARKYPAIAGITVDQLAGMRRLGRAHRPDHRLGVRGGVQHEDRCGLCGNRQRDGILHECLCCRAAGLPGPQGFLGAIASGLETA